MGKVFPKDTENKEDAILGVRNDGIRKNSVGVPTAFADNPGDTDILIDRFSMNDINDGTLIGGMCLAVTSGMTAWTFLSFVLERSHEIKKQRF